MMKLLLLLLVATSCALDLSLLLSNFTRDGYAVLPEFSSSAELAGMRAKIEGLKTITGYWSSERRRKALKQKGLPRKVAPMVSKNKVQPKRSKDAEEWVATDECEEDVINLDEEVINLDDDDVINLDDEALATTTTKEAVIFRTDEKQTEAQSNSKYFFQSASRVHFFEEQDGKTLNKAGHGLHLNFDVFGDYTKSSRIAEVLTALKFEAPVVPQSMYIFKSRHSGGPVTPHQDGTFLRTFPTQTVVGLWLAIDDATLDNGCLWVRKGSHVEPLRRYFVRETIDSDDCDLDTKVKMRFDKVENSDTSAYLDQRWLPPSKREKINAPWEGVDLDADSATQHGFVPVPVAAGSLVILAGTLDHMSLNNTSDDDRHTFQLHVVEAHDHQWAASNWLQYNDTNGDQLRRRRRVDFLPIKTNIPATTTSEL